MYLDGTHNPAGAKELLKFWKENFAGRRIFLVYGAMRDKSVDEIAGLLFPSADFVILTEPLQPRAISAPLLAEMTAHLAKGSIVVRDPAEAFERAIQMASPDDAVFATGSLYLVGDLLALLAQAYFVAISLARLACCRPLVPNALQPFLQIGSHFSENSDSCDWNALFRFVRPNWSLVQRLNMPTLLNERRVLEMNLRILRRDLILPRNIRPTFRVYLEYGEQRNRGTRV